MNLGVIAGVFDPVHLGHVEFIKRSIKEKNLDKLYVLIEKKPRFKKVYAEYEHRKKMVELAVSDIPQAEIYESSSDNFPISASLPSIKTANPRTQIYLLLGDDVAEHIDQWEGTHELLQGVQLVVADRNSSQTSSGKVRCALENDDNKIDLPSNVLEYCRSKSLYANR